jgi:hypothetical protein
VPRDKPLSEKEWETADLLTPVAAPLVPEMISDGIGLAFPLTALTAAFEPLQPSEPAVAALVAQIVASRTGSTFRSPWKRGPKTPDGDTLPSLEGWRELARDGEEVLFGRGTPPQLVTVLVGRDARRETWSTVGVSTARPIRAARDGIRASSWRSAPGVQPGPDCTELRLLVTEQTRAGGRLAQGRFQAPDLHLGEENIVLRLFITPQTGYQTPGPRPETPVRVTLPEPLGGRELIDGGLLWSPEPAPNT